MGVRLPPSGPFLENNMERKLASVRRIKDIQPIEGADKIVCATVDGWKLVTAIDNEFSVGDLVVYFEIDSFLPIEDRYEFLRKGCLKVMNNKEGFRLRTIKLRGQVSQGLIMPLADFPELPPFMIQEGTDLTEILRVEKWEPPIPTNLAGKVRGNFPSFIPKTDQERVQNIFDDLKKYEDVPFEVTIKLDGSSMTVYHNNGVTSVCSRNLDLYETDDNAFWKCAREIKLIEALEAYGKNIAVQGELMGPGVQGNREGLKELCFFVFDVYLIDEGKYATPLEVCDILEDLLDSREDCYFDMVPILDVTKLDRFKTVEDFLQYADTESYNHPIAEGLVFKSYHGERVSFKVINNKYLLKEKD